MDLDYFSFVDKNKIEARKRLQDPDTGEILEFEGELKNQRRSGFRILPKRGKMLFSLPISSSADWKIFSFLALNADKDNVFKGSHSRICKNLRISRNTVSKALSVFRSGGFIKQIDPSMIMLNPKLFFRGNTKQEEWLNEVYSSKDPLWHFTRLRRGVARPFLVK